MKGGRSTARRSAPWAARALALIACCVGGDAATAQFASSVDPHSTQGRAPQSAPAAATAVADAPSIASPATTRDDLAAAELLYRAEKRTAATAAYQRIVDRDGGSAQAWLRLGNLHQLRGDLAGAARAYRRAADLPARPDEAAGVRGKALLNLAMLGLIRARQALAELEADGVPPQLAAARDDTRRRVTRFEAELEGAETTDPASERGAPARTAIPRGPAAAPAGDVPASDTLAEEPVVIRLDRPAAEPAARAPGRRPRAERGPSPAAGSGAGSPVGGGRPGAGLSGATPSSIGGAGAEGRKPHGRGSSPAAVGPSPAPAESTDSVAHGSPQLIVGRPTAPTPGGTEARAGGETPRLDEAGADRVRVEYLDGGRAR